MRRRDSVDIFACQGVVEVVEVGIAQFDRLDHAVVVLEQVEQRGGRIGGGHLETRSSAAMRDAHRNFRGA